MRRLSVDDPHDPLSDLLGAVRFRSSIFCRSEMTAPWGFSVKCRDFVTFHFVEQGRAWLDVPDSKTRTQLQQGNLVLLPHGHSHIVRDEPGSPVTWLDDLLKIHPVGEEGTIRFGGGGATTTLICGGFTFDDKDGLPFLPALPPVLLVPAGNRAGSWLRVAQEVIAGEIKANRLGENTILSRVSDLIFIEAVRSYFSDAAGSPRGWFAALSDRQIGAAISLIHREPNRSWTVASMASAVGMSRSAFALRFSLLLGESPIRYLARRRIARAGSLLEGKQWTIGKIAEKVGYDSDVAFSRAFKRQVGVSPADYRRARIAADESPQRKPRPKSSR
jgi:AraC-like DNA-binding protein